MKIAWAVAAGALLAVPILALPTRTPAQAVVDQQTVAKPARKAAFAVVVHRGNGRSGTIRVGL